MTHTDSDATPSPAEVAAAWQPAGLKARANAAIADALIVLVVAILPTLMVVLFAEGIGLKPGSRAAMALGLWCAATAYFAVNAGEPGARNGQTTGKRLVGIRVVRAADGEPLTRARAFARAATMALLVPIGLPLAVLIGVLTGGWVASEEIQGGLLWCLIGLNIAFAARDPRRRTVLDVLTGTAVVDAERRVSADTPIASSASDQNALAIGLVVATGSAYLWFA